MASGKILLFLLVSNILACFYLQHCGPQNIESSLNVEISSAFVPRPLALWQPLLVGVTALAPEHHTAIGAVMPVARRGSCQALTLQGGVLMLSHLSLPRYVHPSAATQKGYPASSSW